MIKIIYLGLDTFGGLQKLMIWLLTRNLAFGGLKPLMLLMNRNGREIVTVELIHINHGILV
jgi:uncharacterized protein (DUF2384 family)